MRRLGEAPALSTSRAQHERGERDLERLDSRHAREVPEGVRRLGEAPALSASRDRLELDEEGGLADGGYCSDGSAASCASTVSEATGDVPRDEIGDDAWVELFSEFAGVSADSFEVDSEFSDLSSWKDELQEQQSSRPEGMNDYDFLRLRLQQLSPSEPLTDEFLDAVLSGRQHMLPRLLEVPVSTSKEMLPPEARARRAKPMTDLSAAPLPALNVPRREEAPSQRARALPTLPGTYTIEQIVLPEFLATELPSFEREVSGRIRQVRRRNGKQGKQRPMAHRVYTIDRVLQPWARPYYWDCRDRTRCATMSHADEPVKSSLNVESAEAILELFPTKSTLYCWKFGFDLRTTGFPRQLVLCRPLVSAHSHMEFADGTFEDEMKERPGGAWAQDATGVPPWIPGQFEAYGVAEKKHTNPAKLRRTTDKSSPARSAVNAFINLLLSFAVLLFVTPQNHASAAAVLMALARLSGLPLLGFADDFKAWFNQLPMAVAEYHRHGYVWVDKRGQVHYPWSSRLQFGSKPGPSCGQDSMDAVLWAARRLFRAQAAAFERRGLLQGAFSDVVSQAITGWRRLRSLLGVGNYVATASEPLGEYEDGANAQSESLHGQLAAAWEAGYIDDVLALVVGLKRLLIWILCFWETCDAMGIATAPAKAQIGSTIKHLGLVAVYDLGYLVLPMDKLSRLLVWIDRLQKLGKVKSKEIESFAGTVQFCAIVRRDARRNLVRFYRALTTTFSHRYQHAGLIRISRGMKEDLGTLARKFKESGGVSVFPSDDWLEPGKPDHGAWQSDSCRNHHNLDQWTGMGGFYAGEYWWVKLSKEETLVLPVHVTEAVAKLTNSEVFGARVAGGKIMEELDSAPFYDALKARKAKDPRLQEVINLCEAVEGRHNLLTKPRWIASDDNTLADLLSRGAFSEFRLKAREMGWESVTQIRAPRKIKALLSLLVQMTHEMNRR